MKPIRTIAVLPSVSVWTSELQNSLRYAGVAWWQKEDDLYILNASLSDTILFCRLAKTQTFLFRGENGDTHTYKLTGSRDAIVCGRAAEPLLSAEERQYAKEIVNEDELQKALDDTRTFLSRALHRRNAFR